MLCVWNRTPGKEGGAGGGGARVLSSPGEACQAAEVWVTMVLDDAALAAVSTEELFRAPGAGAVLVDMSTVSPAASRQVAEAAAAAGVAYLRAPVSGNPSVVAAGNLGIMVSGDEEDLRTYGGAAPRHRAECLLRRSGRRGSRPEVGAEPDDRRERAADR